MSLHNDINNLTKTFENKQTNAEKKELKKARYQKIKILISEKFGELYSNIENFEDLQELTKNLIKNKNENIDILKKEYFDLYNVNLTILDLKFIEENYIKWMDESKKDFELIHKIETQQQKELEKIQVKQQREEEKKFEKEYKRQKELEKIQVKQEQLNAKKREETTKAIIAIIQALCIVALSPFILLGFFVLALAKNSK